ncbi:MAG: Crp/Fnr family transcriptional regulator [Myxococcota bacterium]
MSGIGAQLAGLSAETRDAIRPLLSVRAFAPGEHLLRGGDRARWCYVLESGLVRELYIGADGRELTRAFVTEGHATGSLLDLLSGGPAVTWIEVIEPTVATAVGWAELDALAGRHPDLQRLLRRVAEALYVRKARREYEMLALTATERYDRWIAEFPGVDARVRRRHVASYLGVTPEFVSRLRQRRRPNAHPTSASATTK